MTNPLTTRSKCGKVRSFHGYTGTQLKVTTGVTFQKVSDPSYGLSMEDFERGLKIWNRNHHIRRNMPNAGLDPLPNRMHIGYVGTDGDTGYRYSQGWRRLKSHRPSRWGWGIYVADDPEV